MNPCPCGGGPPGSCSAARRGPPVSRRVSGPLLDRFDLRVSVQRPAVDEFLAVRPESRRRSSPSASAPPASWRSPARVCSTPRWRARPRRVRADRRGGRRAASGRDGAGSPDRTRLPPRSPRGAHDRRSPARPGRRGRRRRRRDRAAVANVDRARPHWEQVRVSGELPAEAYVAALAGFERMTSSRLRGLLAGREPAEAFAIAIGSGPAPPPLQPSSSDPRPGRGVAPRRRRTARLSGAGEVCSPRASTS